MKIYMKIEKLFYYHEFNFFYIRFSLLNIFLF